MGLMMLAAGPGTTVVVSAIGPEAQAAVDAIDKLSGPDWYGIFKELHAGMILDAAGQKAAAGKRLEHAYQLDATALRVVQAYGSYQSRNGSKDDALKTPLAFDPGDRWEYGINIDFAGKMVEKVSGERLESYFHEHIFGPLGMADTSFKLSPSQRERLVAMHARGADGSLKPIEFEMPQEPELFMGGGGLYSTGSDYLKFVRMFLNHGSLDGKTVLRPETVAMMGQNQIGDVNVVVLKSVLPDSSLDAEFFPGMVKKWGLGFMINTETAPTGRSAGSLAWAGLANTYFWIDPTKNIAGVILMQLLPFADPQALQTFAEFESGLYKVA